MSIRVSFSHPSDILVPLLLGFIIQMLLELPRLINVTIEHTRLTKLKELLIVPLRANDIGHSKDLQNLCLWLQIQDRFIVPHILYTLQHILTEAPGYPFT